MSENRTSAEAGRTGGLLDWMERIGNKLPDPTTLFVLATLAIVGLSHLAVLQGWEVTQRLPQPVTEPALDDQGKPIVDPDTGEPRLEPVRDEETGRPKMEWQVVYETRTEYIARPVLDEGDEPVTDPETGLPKARVVLDDEGNPKERMVETREPVVFRGRSLLTSDGIFWALGNLVDHFMAFPPLGVVLVGMLGIGVAERVGLIGAALRGFMLLVPGRCLTPAMVFIGIMSSMSLDAGYVVLPPVAAALYKAIGRSPLAGLAAVFAGVSAGFNANLFITGLDPMLAGFTTTGAQVVEEGYQVNPACNWWFLMVSTGVITLTGWGVTAWFVERRLNTKPPEEGGPAHPTDTDMTEQKLKPQEIRGLIRAAVTLVIVLGTFLAFITVSGAPLHGQGNQFDRWVEAIVPMLFFCFILPAIVYGIHLGEIRRDRDVAKLMMDSMAGMAPIIVLAFVAAQFIELFKYSRLDKMLAMAGGQWLGQGELHPTLLVMAFIGVTIIFNLFIGSMSAKYAMFAPIFVPMFMMVGVSPELTQAAYRIGDSVSNIITPLNPYLIVILVFMQKFVPRGGIGTIISTMFPYTVAFTLVWTLLLTLWIALGLPLGPDGGLTYDHLR